MATNYNSMAAIAVNKSLLKEYSTSECPRTVYMKDGEEFQIQLFNPTKKTVGAEIKIDGKNIEGILVLQPGERLWLERYINENAKFKFETYEVEANDEEVAQAISDNGNIVVSFYNEKERPRVRAINTTNITRSPWYEHPSGPFDPTLYKTTCTNSDGGTLTTSSLNMRGNGESISCYHSALNDCVLSSSNCDTVATMSFMDDDRTLSLEDNTSEMMETGRVGKGNTSDQYFNNVDIEFEYYPFNTLTFKILPMSRKPVNASDIQKVYCTECGRKLNTKYKFCPFCGNKVD